MCPHDPLAEDEVLEPKTSNDVLDDGLQDDFDEEFANVEIPKTKPLPWNRFWARQVDMALCGISVGIALGLIAPFLAFLPFDVNIERIPDSLFVIGALGILAVVEGILLATIGTTPGKWLLRVQVRNRRGNFPSLGSALHRSVLVSVKGVGLGFACIPLITMSYGWQNLTNNGFTSWDKSAGCVVTHKPLGWIRGTFAVIVVVVILAGVVALRVLSMEWEMYD